MNFESDQHALFCGYVFGILMKAGISVAPVLDIEGNYLPKIEFLFETADNLILDIPSPDAKWRLA